jgi:hypothetical protein
MRSQRDLSVLAQLESLVSERQHPLRHVLALWPAYVPRIHWTRFLAHYEIFCRVRDVPGCIVECGVGRGSSFFTWSRLTEIFFPNDRIRRVYGFDSFEGLQDFVPQDGKQSPQDGYVVGGWSPKAAKDEIQKLAAIANEDNIIAHSKRCEIIDGRLQDTLPRFLESHPGLRISLLHIDVDLYEPTRIALELLYPRVVRGGAVVFDEYGLIPWQGETVAVDEYFRSIGESITFEKFPWSLNPGGFFIKQSSPMPT